MSAAPSQPYLRIASAGPLVRAIQADLRRHGVFAHAADGVFGRSTEEAVRAFQESRDLDPDGIIGPDTWRALADAGLDLASLPEARDHPNRAPHPFLRVGAWGPHVGAIQAHLQLEPTTTYDVRTEEAVRAFQERVGLPADGIVGPRTWAELLRSGLSALDLPPFGGTTVIDVSAAVRRAHDAAPAEQVTAYDVVARLLQAHPEYADGRAGSFEVGPPPARAERLFFAEWLGRVRPLFDAERLERLTTRTVVWGLSLLERDLGRRLARDDFLVTFRAQRTEEILSAAGLALLRGAVRPGTSITRDTWTADDSLEYELYADAIAAFILDDKTRAPLTIGVKAPWGAGKTSLMRMVRRRLDPDADADAGAGAHESDHTHLKVKDLLRDTRGRSPEAAARKLAPDEAIDPGKRTTIWFNAWKYQSGEQLWAGLAHAIVSQIEQQMTPLKRERFWASLHVQRLHPSVVRQGLYRTLGARLLPWALAATAGGIAAAVGALVPGAAAAGAAAVGALERWIRFLREDVAAASPSLVRDPGYEGKLGFLHLVDEDMTRILAVAEATPTQPLVVFIDDLDRCSYTTVAQVIEALNVFLAGDFDSCIFVIAMEPDLVAAQIHVAYEKLFARLSDDRAGDLGWRFLEKMVQLPVALPPPDEPSVGRYITSILGSLDAAEIEAVAADLPDDATEVKEIEELFKHETVLGAANVRPALDRVRKQVAASATVTTRHEAALRKVGRREFAQRLTEDDGTVGKLLRELARELPPNPREIKRFINLFRFYAFIQYWREDVGLSAPTLDGVAKLALLAVRYPHLLSALGAEVARDGEQRSLLSWLETAQGDVEWTARIELAPPRVREELGRAVRLRALVARDPPVGRAASGFL